MKSAQLIWILEDDPDCNFVYREILDIRYTTRYFLTLRDFKAALINCEKYPDFVLADIYLPDGSFLDFLASSDDRKLLRIPFMIVSSIVDIDALRFCFEEGAIDYLTKPFRKNELIVKVERALKISEPDNSNRAAPVREELGGGNDEHADLTRMQSKLLGYFMNREGRPVKRDEIVQFLWNDVNVHPKTLDVHLYNLRKKIQGKGFTVVCREPGVWVLIRQ